MHKIRRAYFASVNIVCKGKDRPTIARKKFRPMPIESFPQFIKDNFEIHEWRHASAILETDFPSEWADLCDILSRLRLKKSYIDKGGGNKSKLAKWIDTEFNAKGWVEKKFDTKITVDNVGVESPTHSVDCFKNRIALELEWNNKDPFYDRDLNNFRLLFDLRVISVGIILTRSDELKEVFTALGRYSSYGESTTHMGKLLPRIKGGGGAGCPILVFGINKSLYVDDVAEIPEGDGEEVPSDVESEPHPELGLKGAFYDEEKT